MWLLALAPALHYYTCRHSFEPALLAELARAGHSDCATPCAGAVRVHATEYARPADLTYALQVLPCAREVRARERRKEAAQRLG